MSFMNRFSISSPSILRPISLQLNLDSINLNLNLNVELEFNSNLTKSELNLIFTKSIHFVLSIDQLIVTSIAQQCKVEVS
jgi:hypothetical protein